MISTETFRRFEHTHTKVVSIASVSEPFIEGRSVILTKRQQPISGLLQIPNETGILCEHSSCPKLVLGIDTTNYDHLTAFSFLIIYDSHKSAGDVIRLYENWTTPIINVFPKLNCTYSIKKCFFFVKRDLH